MTYHLKHGSLQVGQLLAALTFQDTEYFHHEYDHTLTI